MVPFVEKDLTALKLISALPVDSIPLYLILNSSLGLTQVKYSVFSTENFAFLSSV